ncbi:MAG: type II/IV secretion system protein, partial [Bdellovibrionales bacterium]|nr:type II/IV secretion system protein [Bdellovibrionales bacterium]
MNSTTSPHYRGGLLMLLKQLGVLSEDFDASQLNQERPLRHLEQLGKVRERDALERIASYLEIPVVDLSELAGGAEFGGLLEQIGAEYCWKKCVAPLYREKGRLVLAVSDPCEPDVAKTVEFACSLPVKMVLALESQIARVLSEEIAATDQIFDLLPIVDTDSIVEMHKTNEEASGSDSEESSAPIVKLTNKIVADAVESRASDVHIEPLSSFVDVRYRVDGAMRAYLEVPKRLQNAVISRFKVLAGMDISERRRPQDGRIRARVGDKAFDLRVSCVPAAHGEKVVLRVLRSDIRELTFEKLHMPSGVERSIAHDLQSRGKLLLVTGPTGSGKTTTLYTCLNTLHDGSSNIETVEDPIEYRIQGINQIQVNESINVRFASALRSILRQDPDIIMVGEIRDEETAEMVMQAAETGHLVLSTLHTNDAPSAIARLAGLGVQPELLSSSLIGILAQRLVRKVCQSCKVPAKISEEEAQTLQKYGLDAAMLFDGKGCEKCSFTGYNGRVGIYSYLHVDPT